MIPTTREAAEGMGRATQMNLALSAGAAAAGYALVSPVFALSVAAGAAVETLSYAHLLRSTRAMFEGRGGSGFGLRFLALAVFLATAIWAGAHPIGLLVGVSLMIPVVVVQAWRHRPPIDPDAPALAADDPEWDRWNPWLAGERKPREDEDAEA